MSNFNLDWAIDLFLIRFNNVKVLVTTFLLVWISSIVIAQTPDNLKHLPDSILKDYIFDGSFPEFPDSISVTPCNCITPNADNQNECFFPNIQADSITSYRFQVFNRWGELVYQTNQKFCWHGVSGEDESEELLPDDVYIYRVSFEKILGDETTTFTGHINVYNDSD